MEDHLSDRLRRLRGRIGGQSVRTRGFGLREGTRPLLGGPVEDLSLGGVGQEPVRGEGGGARGGPTLVVVVEGSGLALQRQQVGLLLLQPLVQPLRLALLLQLPPLELLPQSRDPLESGEGRDTARVWTAGLPPDWTMFVCLRNTILNSYNVTAAWFRFDLFQVIFWSFQVLTFYFRLGRRIFN